MTRPPAQTPRTGFAEFVILMAMCMSLVAMAIDSILPALSQIGETYNVERANSQQFVISFLFAGLAIGQLLAGPLSDSIGRKRAMYIGFGIFIIGSAMSYVAPSYEIMLAGRFIQGLGAAGPRIITIAMVRDRYAGRDMARVMSYIMGVFILVPAIAPSIGQGIMLLSGWKFIFIFFILMALFSSSWMMLRLKETLHPEDIRPFTPMVLWQGIRAVCSNRITVCYMIAAGFIFGAFIGYLNSSQQIFQNYFDVGELFPLYFGLIALSLGAAFYANARLVKRYGMRFIIKWSLVSMMSLAVLFFIYETLIVSNVSLPAFLIYIMATGFSMGMLFGNMNALAMEPMGHMAGIASAVIGCVSLIISMTAGSVIGQLYDGNLIPLTLGFLIFSSLSYGMMVLAEREN